MLEYSRQFVREYPLELQRESGLTESTDLYTWVERGTASVIVLPKNTTQYHWPGLEPRLQDPEASTLTIRPGGGTAMYWLYIGMCRCEGYGFQAVYSSIG